MMALSDPMAANNSDSKCRSHSNINSRGLPLHAYGWGRSCSALTDQTGPPVQTCRSLVARVLKGAYPGDLPIEQPSQFDMVINMKSAQSFGLRVPDALFSRATHVVR